MKSSEEASRSRFPVVYPQSRYVQAGGRISYGANLIESYRTEVPS
jgi:hypothetical protein